LLAQIAGVPPHQIATTSAQIAAALAAEHWEAADRTLIGLTLPPDLIAATASAPVPPHSHFSNS
jgi:hypothetical protein